MRKHADTNTTFSAQNLREFNTTNGSRKQTKTATRLHTSSQLKSTQTLSVSVSAKPIAWEAFRNELEFE
ncbi:MAG TPA: hypothetical protein VLC98_15195 [Phnomibacter sp.]|nr:hypothetical protein [Phnomibacter sp.]